MINQLKNPIVIVSVTTLVPLLNADLILAGITQLITVVLADKINHHEYIRSIKPLIA